MKFLLSKNPNITQEELLVGTLLYNQKKLETYFEKNYVDYQSHFSTISRGLKNASRSIKEPKIKTVIRSVIVKYPGSLENFTWMYDKQGRRVTDEAEAATIRIVSTFEDYTLSVLFTPGELAEIRESSKSSI